MTLYAIYTLDTIQIYIVNIPICLTMKITNFQLERDYLTVKVSSEGASKRVLEFLKLIEVWLRNA